MILRFVPYIGAILAASLPIALAAAVGSDWSMSLWTIALFAVMEPLTGQVVEPLVCGRSAGLLYPSAIRAHVGASLTARLAGEPRFDIGYPEGADQGKKFGRPSALDAGQKRKIADRYAAGETMAELAREYEVGEATIFRALRLEPITEGEIEGPAHEAALSIQGYDIRDRCMCHEIRVAAQRRSSRLPDRLSDPRRRARSGRSTGS